MNFSAVRGYNAYAEFSAQIREAVKLRDAQKVQDAKQEKSGSELGDSLGSVDTDDTVSISRSALALSQTLLQNSQSQKPQFQTLQSQKPKPESPQNENPQTTLKEWMKTSGHTISANSATAQRVSGQTMAELLKLNGVDVEENEVRNVDMDVWCAVSVTEKNAEKARAIQNLLNTTPSGINWGFLLQKLPID
ncbi:MAG: hypothetical protein FWD38_08095 [Oscillospiraceae bacterium]|nr:hypothetical protein [Oscillospiraceae bacterium]